MRRFCSVCGKVTDELHDGLCRQCFIKEQRFTTLPDALDTAICKRCLRHYTKGKWTSIGDDLESVINEAAKREIQNSIKTRLDNPKIDISVGNLKRMGKGRHLALCNVEVEGTAEGILAHEEKSCNVGVNLQLCPDCSRRSGGYYEAILQIRGSDSVDEDEIEKISAEIGTLMENFSSEKGTFISDFKRFTGGADLYFGSAKIARKISHILKEEYGAEVSESPKLVGKSRSGKDEYRITIVLRLPKFREDDIIEFRDHIIQVESVRGSKLIGFDLERRNKVSYPLSKIKDAKLMARRGDIARGMVSEVTPERVQIIDMETYETFYLFDFKQKLKVEEEVEIFRDGNIYLLKLPNEA
ncbi:MAG: 60S ribosomal export protein NMD3 [Candidatus Hydrothermarchaeales archaeon]